jgi:prepilin-type N-terminal cleavage/methylation domain-containing protein
MTMKVNPKGQGMQSPHTNRKNGFTLIELLVVIVIIGLLTSVATVNYITAQRKARDNARKAEISAIATAVESYYSLNRTFPGKVKTKAAAAVSPANNRCENVDSSSDLDGNTYFYYYYYPFTSVNPTQGSGELNKPCSERTATNDFNPTQFSPAPNWIPDLGSFLSPVPIDKKYQGKDGSQPNSAGDVGDYEELLHASDTDGSNNHTRTLVYRHLDNGYAVYTRLEGTDSGGGVTAPTSTTRPAWPTYFQKDSDLDWKASNNIYMISR